MLLIHCPYCGPRPELEFSYARPGAHRASGRSLEPSTPTTGPSFSTCVTNTRGVHAERWRHVHGCARFFNALRDTTTDQFLATYRGGEPMPEPPAPCGETP